MNECEKCPVWKTCTDQCVRIQKIKKLANMESTYHFSFDEKVYYSMASKTNSMKVYFTVDAYEKIEQISERVFKAIKYALEHRKVE